MYIQSFEGRFSDRPFWHTGFVLKTDNDLQRIRASAIDAVIIDTHKGIAAAGRHHASDARGVPRVKRVRPPAGTAHVARVVNQARRDVLRLADDIRAGRTVHASRMLPVIKQIGTVLETDEQVLLRMVRLKRKDEYTYMHCVAVAALMVLFARKLGLHKHDEDTFGLAGLLHDVGKLAIPSEILDKPAKLTSGEFDLVKTHPQAGAKILRAAELPPIVIDACLHHHERIDGHGYPFGLRGEGCSLVAKMTAICDVYDAMTSTRFYKDAWSPQQALLKMSADAGHFDPVLMRTFMRAIEIFPVGSLVRVGEDALAIVVQDNAEEPTLPTVRAFYSIKSRAMVASEDVKIGRNGLLTIEDPAEWGFPDWSNIVDRIVRPYLVQ